MKKFGWMILLVASNLPCQPLGLTQEPVPQKQTTVERPSDELSRAKNPIATIIVENAVLKIVEERSIPARVAGIVQSSQIEEGTLVSKDQVLMKIDDSETTLNVQKTQKELEMATLEAASRVELEFVESSIEVAQAELTRAVRSNQRRPGVVAQSEMDQLSLVVKRSLAEKKKTQFQINLRAMSRDVKQIELNMSQLQLGFHQIQSPLAGMIVEVLKHDGEWIAASESVARVVRLDKLRTEVKLPAAQALDRLLGSTATVYPKLQSAGLQEKYPGKVVFIFPEANPISSEVRVWVEIENANLKLIPGLTGRLEIDVP